MKEMFTQSYFWYFLVCSFFTFSCQRAALHFKGASYKVKLSMESMGILGTIVNVIFLALGFFYMGAWWFPLIMILLSVIINSITFLPLPEVFVGVIGVVAVPITAVLMYLSLFNII